MQDLGSHTLFVAEVVDGEVLSDVPPLTYADYQSKVKPKPEQKKEDKKLIGCEETYTNIATEIKKAKDQATIIFT